MIHLVLHPPSWDRPAVVAVRASLSKDRGIISLLSPPTKGSSAPPRKFPPHETVREAFPRVPQSRAKSAPPAHDIAPPRRKFCRSSSPSSGAIGEQWRGVFQRGSAADFDRRRRVYRPFRVRYWVVTAAAEHHPPRLKKKREERIKRGRYLRHWKKIPGNNE